MEQNHFPAVNNPEDALWVQYYLGTDSEEEHEDPEDAFYTQKFLAYLKALPEDEFLEYGLSLQQSRGLDPDWELKCTCWSQISYMRGNLAGSHGIDDP